MTTPKRHSPSKLVRNVGTIITSVVVAYLLAETRAFEGLLAASSGINFLGSFVAGMFFTSIFTFAPSTVTLAKIALSNNIWGVAFFGSLGAVVGDIVIFKFLRSVIAEDIEDLIKRRKRLGGIFRLRFFRFLIPFLGAIFIALPLSDEVGLAMMGVMKLKMKFLIPISFALNFLGILVVGLVAINFFG